MLGSPRAIIPDGDIADNLRSYARHLRASNVSPRTVQTYGEAVRQLVEYLASNGMPVEVAHVKREHVEAFIEDLLTRRHVNGQPFKPSTAHNRYRGLKAFFAWLADEGEIQASPMARMKPPRLVEQPVAVLREVDLKKLLATVEAGRTFDERRDAAIIRTFIATGARLAEVAGLRYSPDDDTTNDMDLDQGIVRIVRGKGGRERVVGLDSRAVKALDRYLRVRAKSASAREPWLWVGRKGRFGESGIGQMLADRGRQAGLAGRLHAHQIRHSMAHAYLAAGGQEQNAMRLFGWQSREMLGRYAASTGTERALAEQRKLGIGDRL